jgi:hypothetical protein
MGTFGPAPLVQCFGILGGMVSNADTRAREHRAVAGTVDSRLIPANTTGRTPTLVLDLDLL